MRDSIRHIAAPLQKRGIPFAMIYGNHDDRNVVSKQEQADIFRSYSMCLPMNTSEKGIDCDTYNITVLPSDGGEKPLFNLWMLDSAWYDAKEDKCFEIIKPETVEWYIRTSEKLKEENGGKPLESLMFAHIPFPQIMNLTEECAKGDVGAVKAKKDGYIRLKSDITRGVMGEAPSILEDDSGMFEAALKQGDVKGIVTGHDHRNCFEGKYKGIDFIQTSCASFRCYGDENRGVRVFDFDERSPADYMTYFFNYADLCGRGTGAKLRYLLDADDMVKERTAFIAGAAATALTATGAILKAVKKFR